MKDIIVVDGCTSGMGFEFAKKIIKKEKVDEIWLLSRRMERLEALRDEIKKINPDLCVQLIPIDLSKMDEIDSLYNQKLILEKPNIKVLGLCAGFGRFSHFENVPLDVNLNMVDVNLKSTIAMAYYSIPYMKRGSNMMIIASDSSIQPVPYQNMYATTKAAVLSFGRSLNKELHYKGIHVLSVTPLWVNTEFFSHAIDPNAPKVVINYGKIDEASDVMDRAIHDLYKKNKDVSVYGAKNHLQHALVKILPHKLVMKIWMNQQKLDGTPTCRKMEEVSHE